MSLETGNLPRGLPTLLNLKERGRSPDRLSEEIVGTLDLTIPYMLNLMEYLPVTFNQNTPIVGLNSFPAAQSSPPGIEAVVPSGELWWVWGFTVSCTCGVGEAIDLAAAVKLAGDNLTIPMSPYAAAAANQQVRVGAVNFWMPPGSVFCFLVRALTLAPDVAAGVQITRLRV